MPLRACALVAALLALLALPAAAHAAAPWPCLTGPESFLVPAQGVPHNLNASCSSDPDGHDIVLYEWDLDGDGRFETSGGASPLLTHTWSDRAAFIDATIDLGIKVTDAAGESDSFALPLRLTDAINSWFRFEPAIVNPGDSLTLAAYTAHVDAPAPRVLSYAWDLDGDGSFETATGGASTTTLVAPDTLGKRPVGLRVSDDVGNVSTVRRQIEVLARHPSRDQLPWDAPVNLGNTPVLEQQAREVVQATTPLAPQMPAVEPAATSAPAPLQRPPLRRPQLRRIAANRSGLSLLYVDGPKSSRWHVTVRLPADRAARYGLPRRTIVLARGPLTFDDRGVGRSKLRWTKGAYGLFRRGGRRLVDIMARRVG